MSIFESTLIHAVQPLIEIVLSIYKNMPSTVRNMITEQMNQLYPSSLGVQGNLFPYSSNMPAAMGTLPSFAPVQSQQQFMLPGSQTIASSLPLTLGIFGGSGNVSDSRSGPLLTNQVQSMQVSTPVSAQTVAPSAPSTTVDSNASSPSSAVSQVPSELMEPSRGPEHARDTTHESGSGQVRGSESSDAKSTDLARNPNALESHIGVSGGAHQMQSQLAVAPSQLVPAVRSASHSGVPFSQGAEQFDPKFSLLQGQPSYLLSQLNPQLQQPQPMQQQTIQQPSSSANPTVSDTNEAFLFSGAHQGGGQMPANNANVMNPQHSMFSSQLFPHLGSLNQNLSTLGTQPTGNSFLSLPLLSMGLPMNMNMSHLHTQTGSHASAPHRQSTSLIPATQSLKVLAECPHLLMFLFQIYFKSLHKSLPSLMENVMSFIEISPNQGNIGVPTVQKSFLKELVYSQAKSLTFVSFIHRISPDIMSQYEGMIVTCVRLLLCRCPEDVISTRKDLIHATKALMTSELKRHFFPFIDDVLNESFFLGPARHHVLRPFALSATIDFVLQVKESLEPKHVIRIVHIFTLAMNDFNLDIALHSSSCKLLYIMVDCIASFQMVS
jgi:hypothetical protein